MKFHEIQVSRIFNLSFFIFFSWNSGKLRWYFFANLRRINSRTQGLDEGCSKGGRRVFEGWSKGGRSVVEGWSKSGRRVVEGWSNGGWRVVEGRLKGGQRVVERKIYTLHCVTAKIKKTKILLIFSFNFVLFNKINSSVICNICFF